MALVNQGLKFDLEHLLCRLLVGFVFQRLVLLSVHAAGATAQPIQKTLKKVTATISKYLFSLASITDLSLSDQLILPYCLTAYRLSPSKHLTFTLTVFGRLSVANQARNAALTLSNFGVACDRVPRHACRAVR